MRRVLSVFCEAGMAARSAAGSDDVAIEIPDDAMTRRRPGSVDERRSDDDGAAEDADLLGMARGAPTGGRPWGSGGYLSLDSAGIFNTVWNRTTVLVSLLLLQSLSQFILEMYEPLIAKHVIIPLFLTMLVGAGGNAGNQATVRAITGLVTREFAPHDYLKLLRKEAVVGTINAFVLAGIGFARVYYFYGNHDLFYSTIAITLSLFSIVFVSAILGCTLPFLIGAVGFDREHAAPVIQVTMDIVGVFITCSLCSWIIPASEHRAATAPAAPAPAITGGGK